MAEDQGGPVPLPAPRFQALRAIASFRHEIEAPPPFPATGNVIQDRLAANRRAEQLFLSMLRPKQRKQWQHEAAPVLKIIGSDGRPYSLAYPAAAYNVLSPEGNGMCAGPTGVPGYDMLIAQWLVIEANAALFRSIANRGHWYGPCRVPFR